jgi:hypothetical protein
MVTGAEMGTLGNHSVGTDGQRPKAIEGHIPGDGATRPDREIPRLMDASGWIDQHTRADTGTKQP